MVPYLIERVIDREGQTLEEHRPQSHDALRADTAYIMVSLMRGVVQRGTAQRARRELNWPVGGKTGTMDDTTDFDPQFHVWCSTKQNWVDLADGVPAMQKTEGLG